jgi:hypothetical protein
MYIDNPDFGGVINEQEEEPERRPDNDPDNQENPDNVDN